MRTLNFSAAVGSSRLQATLLLVLLVDVHIDEFAPFNRFAPANCLDPVRVHFVFVILFWGGGSSFFFLLILLPYISLVSSTATLVQQTRRQLIQSVYSLGPSFYLSLVFYIGMI
jgi:hypothetical protein